MRSLGSCFAIFLIALLASSAALAQVPFALNSISPSGVHGRLRQLHPHRQRHWLLAVNPGADDPGFRRWCAGPPASRRPSPDPIPGYHATARVGPGVGDHLSRNDQISVLNQSTGLYTNAVTLTINPPTGPLQIVSTSPLPNAVINVPYGLGLVAQGGIPPYNWAITAGTLPPGLNFRPDGSFTGIPTTLGSYPFTAQVRDVQQNIQSRQFILTVAQELVIVTGSTLPSGRLNTPYPLRLEANGGRPPYFWNLVSGSGDFPSGLAFDELGTITGTPSQVGTFSFVARVYDQREVSVTRRFDLTISNLMITTASPLPDATVGAPYSPVPFAAANGTTPYQWFVVGRPTSAGADTEQARGGPQRNADTGEPVRFPSSRDRFPATAGR